MPRTHYTIRSKERNASGGVNDSWIVTSDFIAKANTDDSPYLIANELIAGNIAAWLRLPVPPFGLMREAGRHKGHKMMFASLRFTRSDAMPDDFPPDICNAKMPELCVGILLFDTLIANADRHRYNIQCDRLSNPRRILIFDHDHSLFGVLPKKGIDRLKSLQNRLGISGGSVTHGNAHILLRHLNDINLFGEWYDRIESIPDWFIRGACEDARGLPLSRKEVDAAAAFLIKRKADLPRIIEANKAEFASIHKDAWGLFQ